MYTHVPWPAGCPDHPQAALHSSPPHTTYEHPAPLLVAHQHSHIPWLCLCPGCASALLSARLLLLLLRVVRYFGKEAAQIIIKLAAGNGFSKVVVGQDAIMATPAMSACIRRRKLYGEGGTARLGFLWG